VIWAGTYVSESTPAGVVNAIRKALGDDAREPRFFRTVHGSPAQRYGVRTLVCRRCFGPLKVVAYITDALAIRRIVDHLDSVHPRSPSPTFLRRRFNGLSITSSILNAVVAEDLPGPGTVFLHVDWSFKAPVRPGDTITGAVEVLEVREYKPITKLATSVRRQGGVVVLDGTALCYTIDLGSGR
jgi:hypothetical protein